MILRNMGRTAFFHFAVRDIGINLFFLPTFLSWPNRTADHRFDLVFEAVIRHPYILGASQLNRLRESSQVGQLNDITEARYDRRLGQPR
jgi:hypothetical protein